MSGLPGPLTVRLISLCLCAAANSGHISTLYSQSLFWDLLSALTSYFSTTLKHFLSQILTLVFTSLLFYLYSLSCTSKIHVTVSPVALQTWRWGAYYEEGPGFLRDHVKWVQPGPPGSKDPQHPSDSCFWKNA